MTTAASGSAEEGRTTCWSVTKEHVRRELWSYLALFGLLYLYLGIIICVYALKGVFAQRWIMTLCGVFLSGAGGVHLVISWLCYRHHKRHHKFKCCGGDKDDDDAVSSPPPKKERVRPRGQSLAGFLTPEFAKYAEFSARDRRYDSKRQHFFRAYDPTQISISFAHRYWMEQQKPLLSTSFGNPAWVPSSLPGSPGNARKNSSKRNKHHGLNDSIKRRQLST